MKQSLFLVLLGLTTLGYSQNEFAMHWYFGSGASLDFTSGTPVSGTSPMFAPEGCISPSDEFGNLLFYSNGGDIHQQNDGFVWDQNDQVMPNGELFDTAGCYSTVQSSIVVPKPESSTEYYLITLDCNESSPQSIAHYKGMRYSIIDMTLNGGLGDVTDKGIHIYGDTINRLSEGMTVTRHANGTDFWLITHSSNQGIFYKILITSAGFSAPIPQTIGSSTSGHIKVSHQGNRLVYGQDVFDFNSSTGVLSNLRTLQEQGTGKAFSMNGRYLYSTSEFDLIQYDLNAANLAASKVVLFSGDIFAIELPLALQMGPDCKIYTAFYDKNYLGVINDPNNGGAAANFVKNQVTLTGVSRSQAGLPAFIGNDFIACDGSGIKEETFGNLNFSPNPSTGEIHILGFNEPDAQYQIIDAMGRVCQSGILSTDNIINLSEQVDGLYLIHIYNDHLAKSARIVLKH